MGILNKIFPAELPEKEAVTVPCIPDGEVPMDYAALAAAAGFKGYNVIQTEVEKQNDIAKFRLFLSESGICVYDKTKVRKYLKRICPTGSEVRWIGLHGGSVNSWFLDYESWDRCYSKPIPVAVLITIGTIRKEFPDARFWISDFRRVTNGDPFLAVIIHGEWFIIERWDEPSFRM